MWQISTYIFHLLDCEERASHEHAQRDGENENEWKCQGEAANLHHPQDGQTHNLDQCEEMHP